MKVGDRLAKLNEKKSDRELEREIKNDEAEFRWNNNMKILYRRWENEMLASSGQQGENERQRKKKASRNTSNNGK